MKSRYVSIFALVAVGCGGGDLGDWTGTVSDSAGISIVSNPDNGIWTTSSQWTLEEELRIGTVEGDPEYQFGQVGFIAVDSRERIFVLDTQAQHVRVFTADGEYQQTIGRPGSGPGELGPAAMAVFMGPGDTLLVPDMGNQRVNRYGPDGSSLGSFRLALENGMPMSIAATRSGIIAEQVRPLPLPNRPAVDTMDAIIILETDGTVSDTIITFASGRTLNFTSDVPEINLFSAEPVWRLTDDMTLWYGVNNEYRIGVYDADGALQRIVTKPFEATAVADRDQAKMLEFLEEAWRDAGVPPQAIPRLKDAVSFADVYPAYAQFQVGPGQTMWVQHIQSPSALTEEELANYNFLEDIGAPDWDVFDADGRFLGVVTMPSRFAPRTFVDDKIYGVWRDELDVQYVVRLGVTGIPGGDTPEVPLALEGKGNRGAGTQP